MRRLKIIFAFLVLSVMASFVVAGGGAVLLVEAPQSAPRATAQKDKEPEYVDMKSDEGWQMDYKGAKIFVVRGNFAAHHNGTVILADSAVRYSENRIECFGNVLINKGTTYIYGDRAEYNGETSTARVFANIVKVMDGDATLYTYNFRFNTKSNTGRFSGGGVAISGNNMLESDRGYYFGDEKRLICVDHVQMRNDTYEMKADSVIYNTATDYAQFFTNTNIWSIKDGEYVSGDRGSFDKATQCYTLTLNSYVLTDKQEVFCDTLQYYRDSGYVRLQSNIQLEDTEQKLLAFGDWGEYWKEPGNALLTRRPSVISYDTTQGDTIFMRADSMFMYTRDPVKERLEAARRDSLRQVAERQRADSLLRVAEQKLSAERVAEAEKRGPRKDPRKRRATQEPDKSQLPADMPRAAKPTPPMRANDTVRRAKPTAEPTAPTESPTKKAAAPTPQTPADTLAQRTAADSLAKDSLTVKSPLDTMSKAQRRAYLREQAEKERAELKRIKAAELKVKLDSIGEVRQAKRTAMYRKMEVADSIRRAKEQERADEALRRRLARMERRGKFIDPVSGDVWVKIDSILLAGEHDDSLLHHRLDSIILIYFPRAAEKQEEKDTTTVERMYREIRAYRNVKIYRSDMQAVCDSLIASTLDSMAHMHRSPVLWNGSNQIFSDVMHFYTRNRKLDRALFEGKPMTIAELDTAHYNQVAGKEMISHFKDNEVYRNDVNGNVQTIYYMQEENSTDITLMAYIEAADMTSYIENQQVVGITYRGNPTYTFYPMDKIPATQATRLDGFKWEASRRPRQDSIVLRTIRPSQREVKEKLPRPTFPINKLMDERKARLLRLRAWRDRTDTLSLEVREWLESLEKVD